MFEFGAKLAEAEAGAVCDLGAAVQVQHFDISAVLSKCLHGGISHAEAASEAQLPQEAATSLRNVLHHPTLYVCLEVEQVDLLPVTAI